MLYINIVRKNYRILIKLNNTKGFLINNNKEIEKYNSQQLANHLGIKHQILRSILFELKKQDIIHLVNVLNGISYIYMKN